MATEPIQAELDEAHQELAHRLSGPKYSKYVRFAIAALSSIPWVGGVIGATAALEAEVEQGKANELVTEWLKEHQRKIHHLQATLEIIVDRVEL